MMHPLIRVCLLSGGLIASAAALAAGSVFSFNTSAFQNQGELPPRYTCDDHNISPPFTWQNPPQGTRAYALICADPDAPGGTWYHWVVYNLPPETRSLSEGISTLPSAARLGTNSWGKRNYEGPCPPMGTTHHYIFTLYALSQPLNSVDNTVSGAGLLQAMQGQILATVTQTSIYRRSDK